MDKNLFDLTPISRAIWEDRYALKDKDGTLKEHDILETFARCAKAMASKENKDVREKCEKSFFEIMSKKLFCPAGRILANAGTHYSQLLNCYVIPFQGDSLESILRASHDMAITQKLGGGTGLNYSPLRPEGAYIKGVNGRSCGVIGFIDMMSVMSGVIEQGGSRRGANMGILEVWHPDVWKFVSYKNDHEWDKMREYINVLDEERWEYFKKENQHKLQMYNVSVGVNDEFLDALRNDGVWEFRWEDTEWLLHTVVYKCDGKEKSFEVMADSDETARWKVRRTVPHPKSTDIFEVTSKRKVKASELWQKICYSAWANGCPGVINMSEARRMHNGEYCSPLIGSNPCAEQLLPAYGSCNLGALILPSFVKDGKDGDRDVDWNLLKRTVHRSVRFLDNVLDNCDFPVDDMKKLSQKERRIGLGTVGVHDMLISMKLGYDTGEGRDFVDKMLTFIRDEAYIASVDLAKEKGPFPLFKKDKFLESPYIKRLPQNIQKSIDEFGIRNICSLTQAPTGTTGTMLSVSTGCEPWFALSFDRHTGFGSYTDGCQEYIKWRKDNPDSPKPDYFRTAMEISPEDHLKMMFLFSKFADSSVSKTINLPNEATVEDVSKIYLMAMDNGVKGITIFRSGCRQGVLVAKDGKKERKEEPVQEGPIEIVEDKVQIGSTKPRGNRVAGATTRIHMDNHNMYVTVNKNGTGEIVEVFATVGESKKLNSHHTSGVEDSWAEGLGKMISLALRAGVAPESIMRNLKNIPSDKPVWAEIGETDAPEPIPSPPHAIARVIEEELRYKHPNQIKISDENPNQKGGFCESCGSANIHWKSATCYQCLDCPYSRCGS